ncbi:MAG: TetR/AcrR family transcriptional regulator [Huintestinicola sp.]
MGRENKKEAVAAIHREQIMKAAGKLFSEKGYAQTTIEDISKKSDYSRRTIYAYYESKDDILHHIIEKGLEELKQDIDDAIHSDDDFIGTYRKICMAMSRYQREYPNSADSVNNAISENIDTEKISDCVKHILILGTEINTLLADLIKKGQESGVVRKDIIPALTVYVLWSSITSLLTLNQTKGKIISEQHSVSENDFLDYGFRQIINSILEVKI